MPRRGVLAALLCCPLLLTACQPAAEAADEHETVLVAENGMFYSTLAWLDDGLYYVRTDQTDRFASTGPQALWRVRPGEAPEPAAVDLCPAPAASVRDIHDLFPFDGDLGAVVMCASAGGEGGWSILRHDPDTGTVREASSAAPSRWTTWSSGTLYGNCPGLGLGPMTAEAPPVDCFGADVRWPAALPGGGLVYFTARCGSTQTGGTVAADPESATLMLCRRDAGGAETVLLPAVRAPLGVATQGDRIVLAGAVDGRRGVWVLDGGSPRLIAAGVYWFVALAPGGATVATTASARDRARLVTFAIPPR